MRKRPHTQCCTDVPWPHRQARLFNKSICYLNGGKLCTAGAPMASSCMLTCQLIMAPPYMFSRPGYRLSRT